MILDTRAKQVQRGNAKPKRPLVVKVIDDNN